MKVEEESDSVVDFYEPPAILESAASASACRDALNKAVLDFEETLQRTHKRPEERTFEPRVLQGHPEPPPIEGIFFIVKNKKPLLHEYFP